MKAGDDLEERLRAHLAAKGQLRLEKNLAELLEPAGFRDRFDYFCRFLPEDRRTALLVSGSAIGTELRVGMEYGFRITCGTEVNAELASLAAVTLGANPTALTVLYDGGKLPFADNAFAAVASGHVIEHSGDAKLYLDEHLRVLKSGGMLFLEFPDRYHPQELHCQLVGFEWAPLIIRELCYELMINTYRNREDQVYQFYDLVRRTLTPIGLDDIRQYLTSRQARDVGLKHEYKPAKGFIRLVLEKH